MKFKNDFYVKQHYNFNNVIKIQIFTILERIITFFFGNFEFLKKFSGKKPENVMRDFT